ncbi:MAG TPA: hemopexin repeat-containing protein, partial [Kribbellaceae bacterium]
MLTDASPSYEQLFGDLDFRDDDDARSVYSPAAYLVELLRLLESTFDQPSLLERRPDLKQVLLDAQHTLTESPYLDIVNEVLERLVGDDPYEALRTRSHPFGLPFALRNERLRKHLHYLQVTSEELYRLFASRLDHDIVAREYLGLSPEDVAIVTTPLTTAAELAAHYGFAATESLADLQDVERFSAATGLTGDLVRELVRSTRDVVLSPEGTRLVAGDSSDAVPFAWFELVNRSIRLARMTGLSMTDLGLVLTTCCDGSIDLPALRIIAVVIRLQRGHDLSTAEVCGLAAAVQPAGVEGCSGDILAARNRDYRTRLAGAIDVAENDIVDIVRRYRERYSAREPSPFDRGDIGLPAIALLRRVGALARALGISVGELFDVLVALESDPSLHRYTTFAVMDEAPATRDCYRILEAGDPRASLWLIQMLFAVVAWMQASGFSGQELTEILGGRPEQDYTEQIAVLDGLNGAFQPVAFAPDLFVSTRFGERAAKVIHDVLTAYEDGVVSTRDERLLRLDRSTVDRAAYDAVTDLGVIAAEDFQGLGLGERLAAKIFGNLVRLGHLRADGALAVEKTAGLRLATDFGAYRELLFKTMGAVANGSAAFFPSDLVAIDHLTAAQQAELYDNLVFNGHIDENGDLVHPEFFVEADNLSRFEVNADLSDAAPAVLAVLDDRIQRFRSDPLPLDPEIFTGLRLTEARLAALTDSLRFNGHLDEEGGYRDKPGLLSLRLDDFGLAIEFYPYRKAILDAMKRQVADFKAELYTFTPDDFVDAADDAVSHRVMSALDGRYTSDGRVIDEALFADPEGSLDLGPDFPSAEEDTVFRRIAAVLTEQQPYRLDPAAVTNLGFDDEERDRLLALLGEAGYVDDSLAVAEDRLGYFRNVNNAIEFTLPGLEDFSTDVFFLLHAVAAELGAAIAEIGDLLADRAERQKEALYGALADAFGVPAATAAAICEAVTGGPAEALDVLVAPVLAAADETGDEITAVPADPQFRLCYRRVRRFALLASKLGLDATEVGAVFRDQDLVGKFPERLALPPELQRFDAVLESFDGNVYAFGAGGYCTYSASTYALASPTPKALKELSPRFGGLVEVDAAFAYPTGTEWIVGHDRGGTSRAFTRERGSTRWVPKDQLWGKVKNNFDDPARIDAAFVDEDGRTYLFAGDQYVRYSGADYTVVDEGYPRSTAEWWEHEGLGAPLPPAFRDSIDACFHGRDDRIHVFSGDRWLAAGANSTEMPIASRWGKVRNTFEHADRVDAAYADRTGVHLYSGDQVVRYSDSIENDGVTVDEGYPRQIRDVPPGFEAGVDAAFTDLNGVLHLFKDGRTVALTGPEAAPVPTAERWGVLAPVLPSGTVDAAFVGLDGKTYLFSGSTYLRYSTADYSTVDLGYPRSIARDWGGLSRVDASFVMDGNAYLFGVGGLLFDLPVAHEADLDAGELTAALRNRFLEHGLSPSRVKGKAPEWQLTTEEGISLTVRREGLRVKVYGDGSRFYVRYSTKDYGTPDAGYPKPLSDNWWNLPAGFDLRSVDAVFTGRDGRTYLFAGDRFVWFDARHRWWSEPLGLREHWDSIPFDRVDAAFVGQDGRTYVFSGPQYVRYSTDDYTRIDDWYPATVSTFWGNVVNNLGRTGKVDATLVTGVTETVDGVEVPRTYTYLFSGNQFVRYEGRNYAVVQDGYPRSIAALAAEAGLAGLDVTLDGVDAAFADRRTAYLFRGSECHAVSASAYRRYDDLGLTEVKGAFTEDGAVLVEGADGWTRRSALEGRSVTATPYRPRTLRTVPERFRTGLDAVLSGVDGNTYLFKGASCFNVQLNREYPLVEEWGRPRNAIYHNNRVDAAFVGRDSKTYLFSDDQYVVYPDAGTTIDGDPVPIREHWGGLTSVTLAYVRQGKTYLFEKPDAAGAMRYVVYSGTDYSRPDDGYPAVTDAGFWQAPEGFPVPDAVLFEGDTMLLLSGERCVSYSDRTGKWSYPRPIDRIWRGFGQGLDAPNRLRAAFTALDGATYFFFGDSYARYADGAFSALVPIRDRWGISRNPFVPDDRTGRVDAAFVWRGEKTYLFSGDHYVRYSGPDYRSVDAGYPKKTVGNLRQEEPFASLPESVEDILPGP